jgi:hypothetical protein
MLKTGIGNKSRSGSGKNILDFECFGELRNNFLGNNT